MKNTVSKNFLIFLAILLPNFLYKFPPKIINNLDKKLYFSSFVLLILLFLLSRKFNFIDIEHPNNLILIIKKVPNHIFFLVIFLFILITQNYLLNYEVISWDIPSYLAATYDIKVGNLPYTTQWETKGPLLAYIYYFLSLLSGHSYIIFRLINDLVLFLISLIIFRTSMLLSKNDKLTSFLVTLFFSSLFSMRWYVSEYSEIFCLFFIGLSFLIYLNGNSDKFKFSSIGFLISLSFLINQVSFLFLFPYLLSIFLEKTNLKKRCVYLTIGFLIPILFFITIYLLNNEIDILIINYLILPFTYVSGYKENINLVYEFIVWLREFFYFSNYLYYSIMSVFFIYIIELINSKKFKFENKELIVGLNILIGLSIFFIGTYGFSHHLIYFLYFLCLGVLVLKNLKLKIVLLTMIFISSTNIFINSFEKSIYNLSNINQIQNNYPIYNLSKDIKELNQNKENFSVFALDNILLLYYLDAPNYSFIIHPTNHFQDYILNILIKFEKVSTNELEKLINSNPDVLICNSGRTHRGKKITEVPFCDLKFFENDYYQLDSKKYRENKNIDLYYDPNKDLNIFIKVLNN